MQSGGSTKTCPICGQLTDVRAPQCLACGHPFVDAPLPTPYLYGAPASQTDTLAIVALVLGAISLFAGVHFLGIVAAGVGIASLHRQNNHPGLEGCGLATAGIVMGSIAFLIGLAAMVFGLWMLKNLWSAFSGTPFPLPAPPR